MLFGKQELAACASGGEVKGLKEDIMKPVSFLKNCFLGKINQITYSS